MRLVRLLLAVFLAWPLGLSSLAAQEPPRFLIEKIAVEGASRPAGERIVVSSSLLEEGESYTEEELRQAIHRIRRLPFVLDADFALEKGSERGRFALRITIEEPRPVFVNLSGGFDVSPAEPGRPSGASDRWFDFAEIGVRQFVGENGLAFASIDRDQRTTLGYTRYGLFGRGVYANLLLTADREWKAPRMSLLLNVPVTGNHAVLSSTQYGRTSESHEWEQGLFWRYDSTDDPLFPREGFFAEAGGLYRQAEADLPRPSGLPEGLPFAGEQRSRATMGSLYARQHWPVAARQSVSLGLGAASGESVFEQRAPGGPTFRVTGREHRASLDATHLVRLDRWQLSSNWRELWLETRVGYERIETDNPISDLWFESLRGSVQLAFRNAWGIARFSLSYHDSRGGDR